MKKISFLINKQGKIMELYELNNTYKDLDDVWISFQETLEEQKLLDCLDHAYKILDKGYKEYWGRFSEAYRNGCDLYTGSTDLPKSHFNSFLLIILASCMHKQLEVD
jgi:hypothetical protein